MTSDGMEESESLGDLFCEIWERESQPELTFPINNVGTVRTKLKLIRCFL